MKKQVNTAKDFTQARKTREELEQHIRARAWKDDAFRQEFLTNPQAVLQRDFAAWFPAGEIPSIKVVEEEEQSICFLLPPRNQDALSDTRDLKIDELSVVSGATTGTCLSCGCDKCGSSKKGFAGNWRLSESRF